LKIRADKVWQATQQKPEGEYREKLVVHRAELAVVVHVTPGANGANSQRVNAIFPSLEDEERLGTAWIGLVRAVIQWLPDLVRDELTKYLETAPVEPPKLWKPGDPV
jgi:hypothetical protein